MNNHTKLPWMVVVDDEWDEVKIVQKEGYQPGYYTPVAEEVSSKEDAELIVHMVNKYERIVESLESIESYCLSGPASGRSKKVIEIQSIAQNLLAELNREVKND